MLHLLSSRDVLATIGNPSLSYSRVIGSKTGPGNEGRANGSEGVVEGRKISPAASGDLEESGGGARKRRPLLNGVRLLRVHADRVDPDLPEDADAVVPLDAPAASVDRRDVDRRRD